MSGHLRVLLLELLHSVLHLCELLLARWLLLCGLLHFIWIVSSTSDIPSTDLLFYMSLCSL